MRYAFGLLALFGFATYLPASVIYTMDYTSVSAGVTFDVLKVQFVEPTYIEPPTFDPIKVDTVSNAFFVPRSEETCSYLQTDYCSGPGTYLWYDSSGLQVKLLGSGGEYLTFFQTANTLVDGVYNGPYNSSAVTFTVKDPPDVPEPGTLGIVGLGLVALTWSLKSKKPGTRRLPAVLD